MVFADLRIFSAGSMRSAPIGQIYNGPVTPPTRLSPIPTEIVDAFRAVAPAIEAFAQEHGLLIERYRRGKPAWELRFARRLGGEAVIAVTYRERTGHVLDISAVWWLDDRASKTRRLRSEKVAVYDRRAAPANLAQQLGKGRGDGVDEAEGGQRRQLEYIAGQDHAATPAQWREELEHREVEADRS